MLRRWIAPTPLWVAGLLLLPMLLDGGMHLLDDLLMLGLRGGGDGVGTLNFALRMLSGLLCGVAVLVVLYPRLERDLRRLRCADHQVGIDHVCNLLPPE